MKNLTTLAVVLALTVSCSAQWGKKVKGNGNTVTIDRSTGDYEAIAVSGWFDVDLVEGEEGKLTIEGESNLLEYIVTEVKNGKLVLKTEKGVNLKPSNWNSGIRITVPVEGDITFSGQTSDFDATISGSGDIRAFDLEADNVNATVSGSADIKVTAKKMLKARVSGSGDITYKGNPEKLDTKTSGSGDISKG